MKPTIFFLSALCLLSFPCFSQLTLTLEISGLRNNTGQIHFELSNEKQEQIAGITKSITDNACTIVISDLKPGSYSFRFFHDENKNSKLDTNWLGIPREGFGFSNNPTMTFGPPSFEKTLFLLNESKLMKSKPKYY